MSQSIDVGTVLGGRYKVTASIVTSRESDLVLDGVDQVLNRPVSILVAGSSHADQLAQSAREVAMGERHDAVQVLDLGISHGSTYLITNHTSPADLLDLIVPQEAPYIEPFFTDTLGSEIFGESRSHEPETYDGTVDPGRPDQYIRYDEHGQPTQEHPVQGRPPQGAPGSSAGTGGAGATALGAAGAGAAAAAAAGRQGQERQWRAQQAQHQDAPLNARPAGSIPPPPSAPPRSSRVGGEAARPESDQPRTGAHPSPGAATGAFGAAAGAGAAGAAAGEAAGEAAAGSASGEKRSGSRIAPWPRREDDSPAGEAPTSPGQDAAQPRQHWPWNRSSAAPPEAEAARPSSPVDDEDYEDYEDDESTRPRSMPWLVGGVLAVVLIAALIFAFTTLGGLFQPQQAGTASSSPKPTQQAQPSASPVPSQTAPATPPPAPPAPPAIDSVTRLNPGELSFANAFDSKLPLTFDGNTATYWSDMEFAREDWGAFTKSVTLLVQLAEPAQVKQVTLVQSGGLGGNFSIYTNNQPNLTGATLAGTTSFTGPQVTVPVGASPTVQYVLVQINSLPRLSAPKTQYPFGLRLAEIKVE
ncbi:hypothetical protein GCM10027449_00560 [Sinomonas notoginsengisoli]|uniref:ABC transporter substrate-binding protein n=1 Tax=Sinomonas notoginsengisoli TaxID=1457311 RepID=UPI001F3DC519|nr:ABC transporter substrate-binding protein [Sinomonas notoginsengisoli]